MSPRAIGGPVGWSSTATLVGAGALALGAAAWFMRRRVDDPRLDEHEDDAPQGAPPRDDVEALARVITSEARGYSRAERAAIGWTVRNRAHRRGVSILRLVCWPTCGPCCKGRPFSSARTGTAEDLALARQVLAASAGDDPTRGASAFFEPAVQDRLIAANRQAIAEGRTPPHPNYRRTAAEVREHWAAGGQQLVATIGAFEFWNQPRPSAQAADLAERRNATGAKYNREMTGAQISAAIRADIKAAVVAGELPRAKYGVRLKSYSGGQSVSISFADVGFELFDRDFLRHEIETDGRRHWDGERLSEAHRELIEKLEQLGHAYNFNNSRIEEDYFNVNYYLHVRADHDYEARQRREETEAVRAELAQRNRRPSRNPPRARAIGYGERSWGRR